MEITYRRQYGFRLPAPLRWKQAALCALIIGFVTRAAVRTKTTNDL
jgi:hypothetical protein